MFSKYINGVIYQINIWYNRNVEQQEEYDEEYKASLEKKGGLNINITKDCKNWITRKINLLFNLISAKIKPG